MNTRLRDAWTAGYESGWRAGTDHETPSHPHLGDMRDDSAFTLGWLAGNRAYRSAIAYHLGQETGLEIIAAYDRYSDYLADGGWVS